MLLESLSKVVLARVAFRIGRSDVLVMDHQGCAALSKELKEHYQGSSISDCVGGEWGRHGNNKPNSRSVSLRAPPLLSASPLLCACLLRGPRTSAWAVLAAPVSSRSLNPPRFRDCCHGILGLCSSRSAEVGLHGRSSRLEDASLGRLCMPPRRQPTGLLLIVIQLLCLHGHILQGGNMLW